MGTFSYQNLQRSQWQQQKWKLLLVPCPPPSSSQVIFPFWGALPVQAALFVLLPASLSVPELEKAERAEAALTPLPLLPTWVVEIQLRTCRQLRVSRALLSKRNLCTASFSVSLGKATRDTQREGAPHLPPLSLGKENSARGAGREMSAVPLCLPLPGDEVDVVPQRRVVSGHVLCGGVLAGAVRFGGVRLCQRPQADQQRQGESQHGHPQPHGALHLQAGRHGRELPSAPAPTAGAARPPQRGP